MLQDVPTVLGGRYRIVERLGRGGMADVYRADDVVLRRSVAIKLFRGGVEREAHLARFRAEVRTLARLTHPHLVALYDAGGDVAEPWCAMEFVDGGSLGDRTSAVHPGVMARYGAQVASALDYVHAEGIVHRDVKPSNVLIGSDGGAFLSDFGIARLVDGTRMTQSGLMLGTAAFLSPEQVRGEAAGPAADVYALGLVLLEGLTAHREYPGTAVESAVARLTRPPAVPDELGRAWGDLLAGMTATAAADRPTAHEAGERLTALARVLAPLREAPQPRDERPPVILRPPTVHKGDGVHDAAGSHAAHDPDATEPVLLRSLLKAADPATPRDERPGGWAGVLPLRRRRFAITLLAVAGGAGGVVAVLPVVDGWHQGRQSLTPGQIDNVGVTGPAGTRGAAGDDGRQLSHWGPVEGPVQGPVQGPVTVPVPGVGPASSARTPAASSTGTVTPTTVPRSPLASVGVTAAPTPKASASPSPRATPTPTPTSTSSPTLLSSSQPPTSPPSSSAATSSSAKPPTGTSGSDPTPS